ncbi:MAG: PocR ligand-binding domain-containing protein [Bacilli bacterium]|nr:PocR ligand-binding domain-containing protein [Bacilli bacterium]
MNIQYDKDGLRKLLKDFYLISGIKLAVFDTDFKPVVEYPEKAAPFCQTIRNSQAGLDACHKCDKEACIRSKEIGEPHLYTCHAGLKEAIVPIIVSNVVVGHMILAQMIPEDDNSFSFDYPIKEAKKYGVSEKRSKEALLKMKPVSNAKILAAMNIMDAVASFVYIKNIASWKNEDIASVIDKYIKGNLDKKISSEDICLQFSISRSYLYKISIDAFGTGIKERILSLKIEKAKELLKQGEASNTVAKSLGFDDPSYFTKVFKRETGLSPGQFAKK